MSAFGLLSADLTSGKMTQAPKNDSGKTTQAPKNDSGKTTQAPKMTHRGLDTKC